jgi:hypothetical protein
MSESPAISFTAAQLAECDEEHDDFTLGCPVCALYLLYAQDMVELGVGTARVVAETGCEAAQALLKNFESMRDAIVARHLERPQVRFLA